MNSPFLVSTDWLADNLATPDVAILDGSWYLPAMGRDAAADYAAGHIPGARRFDIDAVSDPDTDLPHMLPRPERFASMVRRLGIGDGQRIVVYDGAGLYSAPRVWWMFRVMGHDEVAVLDGGFPKWVAEGRPVSDNAPRQRERHFTARRNAGLIRDLDDMRAILASGAEQVVDARSAGRFAGTEPEPRPGLRGGHVPGSLNLPFAELVRDGRLKPREEIEAAFRRAGVDLGRPIVTTCGSGVSAAILSLALAVIERRDAAVYDGSWAEWGAREDLPVETGPR